jgi:uncharacterized protein (DUF305 family)
MSPTIRSVLIALLLAVVLPVGLIVATGGGESDDAKDIDGAFITSMVPHHEEAVEMARVAMERGRRREIKRLADAIVSVQTREIDQLDAAHRRLFGSSVPAQGMAHGDLGLSEDKMGMGKGMPQLEEASDFDMAFINAMITHHQGAIRMARVEIDRGADAQLKALARRVVVAQSREIDQLNRWHAAWYGSGSPAGGVPPANEPG